MKFTLTHITCVIRMLQMFYLDSTVIHSLKGVFLFHPEVALAPLFQDEGARIGDAVPRGSEGGSKRYH